MKCPICKRSALPWSEDDEDTYACLHCKIMFTEKEGKLIKKRLNGKEERKHEDIVDKLIQIKKKMEE